MTAEREAQAARRLCAHLRPLFRLATEVQGTWPLDDRPLRIDILARPKPAALDLGFDIAAFGVEVKDPQSSESVKKLLNCVMQAYTYGFCEFEGIRPSFVLIYPPIEKFFEHDWVHKYGSSPSEQYGRRELTLLRRVMQRANVGEFVLSDRYQYEFTFGGGRFFDPVRGRSRIRGLGLRRYVGSQKGKT